MYKYRYDTLNFVKSKLDNVKLIDGLKSLDYQIWGFMENTMKTQYKAIMETTLLYEQEHIIEKRIQQGLEREWIYRNGHKSLHLMTRFGVIQVKRPQLRKKYISTVLPRYSRHEEALVELVSDLYTLGVSTRKMETALKRLLGTSLSASKVSSLTAAVSYAVDTFHKRSIQDNYVYIYFDGIPIKAKHSQWEHKKGYMVLVAYGVTSTGKKEIIDFMLAHSESADHWSAFIFNLYERGLKAHKTKLIITDGAKGLHKAINEIYPRILRQRCWVHKLRNVADYITKNADKKDCLEQAKSIYPAETRKDAMRQFNTWKQCWSKRYPKAVQCIENDLDELLNIFYFPKGHRVKIRTTNPIERAFREFKRRTKVMDNYLPSIKSCEKIFFALTEFLNKRWKTKIFLRFPEIQTISPNIPLRNVA